jgi:kumamolisin
MPAPTVVLPQSRLARLAGVPCEPVRALREPMTITVRVPPMNRPSPALVRAVVEGRRPPLTRVEYRARFAADPAAVSAVIRWATRRGYRVRPHDLSRNAVDVTGPASRLAADFGVTLVRYHARGVSWLSRIGPVHLPGPLVGRVIGVLGFDEQPLDRRASLPAAVERGGRTRSFTAPQVGTWYGFPAEADGAGQTIGVIALGGGFRASDLRAYFTRLQVPHPRVTAASVQGARNRPLGPSREFDGEVTGDVQTVGALAPGAHLVVYFAPNTERGFLAAVAHAVHDRRWKPSVISVSWGRNERHWSRRTLRQFDQVLQDAALMGVTVCCSSGDFGALADPLDRTPGVCFPASSAWVLACGGTSLGTRVAGHIREHAWANHLGASGGGESVLCRRPRWQEGYGRRSGRGRLMPDVAANGDPESGYRCFVAGAWHVGAGTSAAAPVWAALIARLNQLRGRPVGLVTPALYRGAAALVRRGALRPVPTRPSGPVPSRASWNRHTGLGVPHGVRLHGALPAVD